jgi:hypothetical protein
LVDNDEIYIHKYIFQSSDNKSKQNSNNYIFKHGEKIDYFILIVEGCLIAEVGKERTEILAKQFDHFGERALIGIF